MSVRGRIQCAGQCMHNPACKTATFDQINSLCSLFDDFENIGQLIQDNGIVTFVRKVNPFSIGWNSTGITVAGVTGVAGIAANQFNHPYCVVLDSSNTLYVSDQVNQRVQKWLPNASSATTVAGQSNAIAGSAMDYLNYASDLIIDSNDNLYIVDAGNDRVVLWNNGSSSGLILAGTGIPVNTVSQLSGPISIEHDSSSGTLYISDTNNHRVVEYLVNASFGTVVAGGNGGGTGITQLYNPRGLYFDLSTNSLLIANNYAHNIVRWVLGASSWTLIIGSASGTAGITSTMLNYPTHIVLDSLGNMYVSDEGNHRIQFFLTGQSNGTTIAGMTGTPGNTSQLLYTPSSVAVDSQFNIYVTDYNNHRVQKFLHY
ncbi:unnamed protein product [Adineta steineri]|uniref:Apple domain-containing protein n=1 Tax=Adineta steineri TaxID=433720 RepID=A0A814C8P3_9BILA|nr:unnamed protein product [Adineta steineri]